MGATQITVIKVRRVSAKEAFMEAREDTRGEYIDFEPWDGKEERPTQRQLPALPMKFHSNKWVERFFK